MLKIDNLSVADIAKVLVLERASNGRYHCPILEKHNGDHENAGLNIKSSGEFVCTCSAMGRGWIELASTLYGIDKSKAEEWLRSRLKGEIIGEQST